jgi:two-component system chemotaxis response regulator CheB
MRPHGGHVYVAPEGQHLVVDDQKRFQLLTPSAEEVQVPSVDRLFQSLAAVYPGTCVGLVLSGMGHDGAQGVVAIRQQGGLTLAQDEASSIIFGMPKSAIDTGAVAEVWPLSRLAWRLVQLQNITATTPPP